jgi:hypothetical protein
MVGLSTQKIKADGARFGPLGTDAVANRLLGILWHQVLKLDLGLLVLKMHNDSWRFKSRADDHTTTRARAASATPTSSDGASLIV